MSQQTTFSWTALTALPAKKRLYADDGFFREGMADLLHLNRAALEPALHRTALVLYKPEAIAGRRVGPASRLLAEHGFAPIAAEPVRFTGPTIHGLWRYQLRRNTLDKIRLYTRWATEAPALLVAYRDVDPTRGLPAAVRLKAMKGPAAVHRRQPHDLRSRLGSPNSILNFLHSADEPADIAREIAVLVAAQRRDNFIAGILAGDIEAERPHFERLLRRIHRQSKAHDVVPDASAARLRCFIDEHADRHPVAARAAALAIEQSLAGRAGLDLRALENALGALGTPDPMDVFVFGTQFIERDLDGQVGELDEDCGPAWRARLEPPEDSKVLAAHV